ncbi:hypothetical protein PFFVO_05324 [Plasmodium falciparum Vietnam Oak-Knoll (FVO)]|uniref:Uncharacterized protein n=1 Tax=Plasmodium falciparum Vietnam Oak-Knoll (FVO) TaxID=1036723 RepID=A0A024V0K3_PLAFA|nr:hypothetical protein PFFVO_05324 [Plasmodium falciparum Vietnam Oak-Knoll (FVO)]
MKDENKEAEKKKKKRKKKRKSKKSDNKENEVTLVSNDVKSDQLVQEDKNEIQNPLVDNEAADSTADQNPDKKVFVITYSWKNLKDVNDKAMKLNLDDQMKESNYTNNNKNDKGVLLNLFGKPYSLRQRKQKIESVEDLAKELEKKKIIKENQKKKDKDNKRKRKYNKKERIHNNKNNSNNGNRCIYQINIFNIYHTYIFLIISYDIIKNKYI